MLVVSLLTSFEAYSIIKKYDFIYISETYPGSSFAINDRDLSINGYNLICANHSSNKKRGGVCIHCKEPLAVKC